LTGGLGENPRSDRLRRPVIVADMSETCELAVHESPSESWMEKATPSAATAGPPSVFAVLAFVLGITLAGVSMLGISVTLLTADPVVEIPYSQAARVFSHYVAHKQEIVLMASGIGFLTGNLVITFGSASLRITRALSGG
jgi:hypothetical protein